MSPHSTTSQVDHHFTADHTSHLLHSSKLQRFIILYERNCHTYNGLCRCSHNWNTFSSCTTSRGSEENAMTLPSTMQLPISSEDTLHFYRYLHTHILIANEQFLLLIDVPLQDHAQQLEIYDIFNLVIPQKNFSAYYNINNRYLGIMYDETKAVEILVEQFNTCQKASRQFCSLNTPLQPLVNPPTCIATLYTKDKADIKKRCSLQIRKANSVSIPTPIAPNVWILT